MMKIYIDFDDVICETGQYFSKIAKELFDIDVPYQQVQFFNLQKTFDLSDEQYDELMKVGHLPENLLRYEETKGASETINKWLDEGHEVSVITGRPFEAYEPSRQWLDEHNLERVPLFCVDKYGRENFNQDSTYNLSLEQLYNMNFDIAIEDSPAAFEHVMNFEGCKIAVYDRPWNKNSEFPNDRFVRCKSWKEIEGLASEQWERIERDIFPQLFSIDLKDYDTDFKVTKRPSVRAVIVKNNLIAMAYSKKENYYKFPGGGIEEGEDKASALIREVKEEVGLVVKPETIRPFGSVLRRQKSNIHEDTIFEQENFYYFCECEDRIVEQNLDEYEEEAEFVLRYVDIDQAIKVNSEYKSDDIFDEIMVKREKRVLGLCFNHK